METHSNLSSEEKSRLDRALSWVTAVEPGETKGALLLALNLFLLLAAYYILKTVREALILTEGGAEIKSYSSAVQTLLLLLLLPAYFRFTSRIKCLKLIPLVNLFFVSHLGVFFLLGNIVGVAVGVPFFIWVGIFNVFLVAQFWACANDTYTEKQGKRLFVILGLGSALGAGLGGQLASRLLPVLGPYWMMLLAAGVLGACMPACRGGIHCATAGGVSSQEHRMHKPLGAVGGFDLLFRNRYLFLIAVMVLLLNLVNTTGEFLLSKLLLSEADQLFGFSPETRTLKQVFIGRFYGDFFGWVSFLSIALQLVLVSRILKHVGIVCALLFLPLIGMAGYASLVALPLLSIIRFVKVLENGFDYSLQNTAQQALFLPLSREAKYNAKAVIDTFFWRMGDVLQAVLVYIGGRLALDVAEFALVNLAFVFAWLFVVVLLFRERKKVVWPASFTHGPEGRSAIAAWEQRA